MSSCCLCSKSNPSLPFASAAFSFQQFPSFFVTASVPPFLIHTPGADRVIINYWFLDSKNYQPTKKQHLSKKTPPKSNWPTNKKKSQTETHTNFSSSFESQMQTTCKNYSWTKSSFIAFILQAKFMNSHSNRDREKTYGTKESHSPEDEMEKGTSMP